GDWQRALPVLEAGCGVLITPMVADMNGAGLYDRIDVTGIDGPVACTVAGIGQPMGGATFISGAARDRFVVGDPINAVVLPSPEARLDPSALAQLEADIRAVAAQQGIFATGLDVLAGTLLRTGDTVLNMVNGVLLVMLLLAALGVVNTTLISVTERRHELGLLRAVGATRRQVSRLIVGEAALTGIAGGLLGLVAGLGLTVTAVLVFGGRAFGLPDLDLRAAFAEAALPALRNGFLGLLAAPAICALAAGITARRVVRPTAMRMMVAGHSLGEGRRRTRSIHIRRWTSLALRNLAGARARSVLSALAVTLGTSMVVAANVAGSGFRSAFASKESRQAFAFMFDAFEASLNAVGIVVLASAAFLILNAFGMAVVQRRRQIGALRALGMTRWQVMRLVLSEALLIGGTGTLAGIILGLPLGRGLIGLVRSAGYETGEGEVSPAVLAVAVGLGLGLTLLSALLPARSAGRVSPLVAMRPEMASGGQGQAHSRLPLLGLALIAVAVMGVILAPPGEWAAPPWNGWAALLLALLWLAGLGIVLPALVGVV
ncbi:MAG: ABC transporter permease, partial [Anaerolineales bacterium]|nr:ABC transporter permease [Anaerolineales bacterium]